LKGLATRKKIFVESLLGENKMESLTETHNYLLYHTRFSLMCKTRMMSLYFFVYNSCRLHWYMWYS